MRQRVILLTLVERGSTGPVSYGIYQRLPQAVNGMLTAGVHPDPRCEFPLFNADGTRAGQMFVGEKCTAIMAVMPLDVASSIVREELMWDVPDTAEELV